MGDDFTEAQIAKLERSIEEFEQKIRERRTAINTICEDAGMPPRYADVTVGSSISGVVISSARVTKIQDDTFYGKKQTPAMREYLELRKSQGLGPAAPREIYEALKTGGYQFDTKDETVALVSLRALLRTQPLVFHKLPQGTYGLTSWYPDAKRQSADSALRKGKKGSAKRKKAKRARGAPEAAADNVVKMKASAGEAA
jgi:hypothetical protein